MTLNSIFLMSVFFISASTLRAQVITLDEAIRKTLVTYESVKISELETAASRKEAENAFFNRLFTIGITGQASQLSSIDPFQITLPIPGSAQTISVVDNITHQYNLRASFTQPLFTGFKLETASDVARLQTELLSKNEEQMAIETAWQVATIYLNLVALDQLNEQAISSLKLLDQLVMDTRQMFDGGLLTENDVLKIDFARSERQADNLQIEHQIKTLKSRLADLMSLDSPQGWQVEMPNPLTMLDTVMSTPQRNELISLKIAEKIAEKSVNIQQSAWYPTLLLTANYDYANPNRRYFPLTDEWNSSWDVNLILSFSVWDWGNRNRAIEKATLQKRAVQLRVHQVSDQIEIEIEQADLEWELAKKLVANGEQRVRQSQSVFETHHEQLKAGLIKVSDLLEAETNYQGALANLVRRKADLRLSEINRMKARGIWMQQ